MGSISQQTSPANSRLFKPVKVGNVELKNRIVLAPLTRNRNDDDHAPLDFMTKYYADRACVPGTLLISEATATSREDEGQPNIPGFTTDKQVKQWTKIIDAVHAKGSFFFQQLFALGRAAVPDFVESKGYKYVSSSATPMEGQPKVPQEMSEEEILAKIQAFVDAAKRAVEAGADGVEIHGAHGYLIDQFISDSVNKRTDKWGGSVENRARFLLETVKAVVAAIGAERTAIRLSPYANFQGAEASDIKGQYSYIIDQLIAADYKLAYLSLVEARGDPGHLVAGAKGVNQQETLDFILEPWNNRSPVVVAGAYTPENAVLAVENHYAKYDVLVAFGRIYLANPDLVFRIEHGLDLNPYNRDTFYLKKSETGYNDYPFSEEFLKSGLAKN